MPSATGPPQADGVGNRVHPEGPYEGVPGGGRFKDERAATCTVSSRRGAS